MKKETVKDTISDRFEDSVRDLREAGELRLEALKLRVLESLATLFNSVLGVFILIIVCSFALIFISVALTLLLADLVGSLLIAVLIMAAVFILAAVIIHLSRKKLFINPMVRMLGKLLFENDKKE